MTTLSLRAPRAPRVPRRAGSFCTRAAGLVAAALAVSLSAGCAQRGPAGVLRIASDLPEAPPDAFAGRRVRPTGPQKAFEWRRLRMLDERGELDNAAFERAHQHRRDMELAAAQQGAPDIGGLSPNAWTFRGPDNIGGRTRALLIDPANPQRLIAGMVSGGIWNSADAGASWTPYSDWLPNLAIGSLARDPRNADVLYAGTGEGLFNGDAIGGAGIYKSTDRGVTWSRLPSTTSFDTINRIAINAASGVILASKRYGGIMRSTDAGATWSNPSGAQGSFDVEWDPSNSSRAVAHVIDYDFGASQWFHRVIYTTNAGVTWQPAATGLNRVNNFESRIELAYAPSAPGTVYASTNGQIWRSTDSGVNWTLRTTTGNCGSSWYYNPLWVDPTNANFLLCGGYAIYKSTDGGTTLSQISDGYILTVQPHPDIHAFVPDPGFNGTTNKRVYVTTDGGVHRTDDVYTASRTAGWVSLQPSYNTAQFYGAAGHGPSQRVAGGTQDNGTLTMTAPGRSALLTFGGDGGFTAIDPSDPRYIYGEYITLQIHRSSNSGASAQYIYSGLADAGTAANFIAPFILDPTNPTRMYAGGRSLWRADNVRTGAPAWRRINGPLSDNVSAIAAASNATGRVWIGLNNGQVFRTQNATATTPAWTTVDDNGATNPLPNRYITRIAVDPLDPAIVYVATGGFSADNLWKTTDNGLTWADATGSGATGLPNAPIYGVCLHPFIRNWIYVSTEVGVFASTNGGRTWSTTNEGPGNVSTDEVVFMHNSSTLLAATHGRGLWTINLPRCRADFNADGEVTFDDTQLFVAYFNAGRADADLNDDDEFTFDDIQLYIAAFNLGC